ncbi:MAG TPA: radical SAM protein, partial [bacterium]|nr:radical SAM protein [bacterium]
LYDRPNYPPLSLAYLAGSARAAGHAVSIVDAKFEPLTLAQTVARVLSQQPAVVGITAMTHEITRATEVAVALKQAQPALVIIIGGVHATFLARETLQEFPAFDYAVIGEGEETLVTLLAALAPGGAPTTVPNLALRRDDGIILTPAAPPPADLDALAPPAFDLWPRLPVYHLNTARGCPYRCIFCAQAHGHVLRMHSAERVAAMFGGLVEQYRPERVYFVDETFGLDRARAYRILDLFREHRLGERCPWWAATRVDRAEYEFLRALKDAGCFLIQFGIESGSERVLQTLGKGIAKTTVRTAVANARRARLRIEGLFIVGHPHETRAEIDETLAFINELNPDLLALGIMVPYPGTELAAMIARGEGGYRLLDRSWEAFNKQLGKALELEHVTRRELELAQLRGYLGLYLRHGRVLDLLRFTLGNWRGALAFLRNFVSGREVPDWFPAGRHGDFPG